MVSILTAFIQNYTGALVKFNSKTKLSLFADHMSVHRENSKESRDEILVTNKVAGCIVNIQKKKFHWILHTSNKQLGLRILVIE